MNKKGFTVVELIVSFALTMLVVTFLFEMIISLKDIYVESGIKSQLLNKQAIISSKVNNDFKNKTIKIALKCGSGCLNFFFDDNSSTKLIVDTNSNLFTYGNYTTKLIDGSSFGAFDIRNETVLGVNSGDNDSFVIIKIPISHPLLKTDDFGINITYQYDSRVTSISDISFDSSSATEDRILLKGSSTMSNPSGTTWVDPGYYVVKNDGTIEDTDTHVTITGSVGSTIGTTYTLTYTLRDLSSNVIDIKTRNVTIVQAVYNFAYTGAAQTFTAPVAGIYQIELWGAQGGNTKYNSNGTGADVIGGLGAYSTGKIYFSKEKIIYFYVGGKGQNGGTLSGIQTIGGYNGGGNGMVARVTEQNSGSGGGATDVRILNGNWNNIDSQKSRIIIAAGGGGASNWNNAVSGGYGGALVGGDGLLNVSSVSHTLATGGTQISGGTAGGAVGNAGSPGSFGSGGIANVSHGSGGGGGYYGGGGSGYTGSGVSSGAGGSSFISGHPGSNAIDSNGTPTGQSNHYSGLIFSNTKMYSGLQAMPSTTATFETGHAGDGYAKITLLSVVTTGEASLTSVQALVIAGAGGGGGGGSCSTGDHLGGAGTVNQGWTGGTGFQASCNYRGGAGGGGIGSAGGNDLITGAGGNAGSGGSNSITGVAVSYAGGGGGGAGRNVGALGGIGSAGGGAGGSSPSGNGGAGAANTGSGGGGAGSGTGLGGSGGSGIVVISYLGTQKASGGIITSIFGWTIHTFTSSGTFEVW